MSCPLPDRTQDALAAYVAQAPSQIDAELQQAAINAVIDTLAVALGALQHPAAVAARRYAQIVPAARGATVWGTGAVVTAETAALVNAVPLRGYDFNDLYAGKGSGGHPSDIIPGLIAVAQQIGASGADLLKAIVLGYEVSVALMDTVNLKGTGWDYPNVTAIGAVCGAASLLGLNQAQTREALAITVIPHFASLEIESGELNARGDLTMWKRFNGGDAVRHAVYSTLLAQCGVEGAVRPFEGTMAFFNKTNTPATSQAELLAKLDPARRMSAVLHTTYKRWPVGSRAQSAIQSALAARHQIADIHAIAEVRVHTDIQAFEHLVSSRVAPWEPHSRETADHSLPYIVAAAILDGNIDVSSFDPERVVTPMRREFIQRVRVFPDAQLSLGASGGYPTRVEITDKHGRTFAGAAEAPPGHGRQPFTQDDFTNKFMECIVPLAGAAWAQALLETAQALAGLNDLTLLTHKLTLPDALLKGV